MKKHIVTIMALEQLADGEDDVPCGRHCGVAGVADDVC